MICYSCGSKNVVFRNMRPRVIKTLDGVVDTQASVYKCEDCGRYSSGDNKLYPHGSRYGWDVINLALSLRKKGHKYEAISLKIADIAGFFITPSTICVFMQKYG